MSKPTPPNERKRIGNLGEQLAVDHLSHSGYQILARNWRCPAGEIDIVAQEGDVLAFVEVRTRSGAQFGTPEDSITAVKHQRLLQCAEYYLAELSTALPACRIDLVAIELSPSQQVKAIRLLRGIE